MTLHTYGEPVPRYPLTVVNEVDLFIGRRKQRGLVKQL